MGLIPISNILMEEFVLLHPLIVMGWDGRKIVMAKHIFLTVVACRVLAVSGASCLNMESGWWRLRTVRIHRLVLSIYGYLTH